MKGMTLRWWIVVGLVIAAVTLLVVSMRPSGPIFSVRVVEFTAGDTNVLVEITNHIGSRLRCDWFSPGLKRSARDFGAHGMALISIPAKDHKGMPAEFAFVGSRILNGPWMARWASALERIGIDLYEPSLVQFHVTNVTGWMHSKRIPPNNSSRRF
jgi:hypothetical protein